MASVSPHQIRAARHEARARNYLQKAEMLLNEYDDPDSASALIYEAAKQCINAVANLRGANPGATGAKVNELRSIEAQHTGYPNLTKRWKLADNLHIHADREFLTDAQYAEAWTGVRSFIDDMLAIYAAA